MPRVSVIIPAYNCQRYIQQTIESVRHQTYTDWEIIVIDDGSSDRTLKKLEPYLVGPDSCATLHYLYQENQGVAAARNRGLAIANGEFIAFLDHDDLFLPHKLALQVACLEEQPEIGMVHSGWRRVNSAGQPLGDVEPWHKVPLLDLQGWLQWKPVLFSAMMFRRQWLEKAGGLDPQFQQVCDLDLVQRLALMGCETAWVRQITTCYREHDGNDSLNTPLQARESWTLLNQFFARDNVPETIRCWENPYRYHTLVWIAWRLYSTNYLTEMAYYLEQSWQYSPYSLSRTIRDWINSFRDYSAEYGQQFNSLAWSNSPEWRYLMSRIGKTVDSFSVTSDQ